MKLWSWSLLIPKSEAGNFLYGSVVRFLWSEVRRWKLDTKFIFVPTYFYYKKTKYEVGSWKLISRKMEAGSYDFLRVQLEIGSWKLERVSNFFYWSKIVISDSKWYIFFKNWRVSQTTRTNLSIECCLEAYL